MAIYIGLFALVVSYFVFRNKKCSTCGGRSYFRGLSSERWCRNCEERQVYFDDKWITTAKGNTFD